jgi:hypothetical protein
VIGKAVAAKCPSAFVDILMREGPFEADIFCIEGEILRHASIMQELVRRLRAQNVRVWTVTPEG